MMRRRRYAHESPVHTSGDRKGYALMVVLLITLVVGAVALHAALLGMNTTLTQGSSDRAAMLDDAALAGIEETRSRLNARLDTVPTVGYGVVEDGVDVPNVPGARRWTYVGRRGNTNGLNSTGEYGVMGHIISRVADPIGNTSIRRAEIYQESFARFADFTDRSRRSDGAALYWAQGSMLSGPVHSNDTIRVWTGTPWPQAIFRAEVSTAEIVEGKDAGEFQKGPPLERVARIQLPNTADLDRLKATATAAGYSFAPTLVIGDSANATIRLEFLAIDTDGDGNTTGPRDGYFRVYRLNNTSRGPGYARASVPLPDSTWPVPDNPVPFGGGGGGGGGGVAGTPMDSILFSWNCGPTAAGFVHGAPAEVTNDASTFFNTPVLGSPADNYRTRMQQKQAAFDNPGSRCFLGGDERLNGGTFRANDGAGSWMPRTSGNIPASISGRSDAAYLWPLSPSLNPNYRGVIFVEGIVALSGTVRGRVTVAARKTIVIAHNLAQAQNPGAMFGCFPEDDIVGLFAGEYVLNADNALITPQWRRDNSPMGTDWILPRKDFDPDTRRPDLIVHAVLLALQSTATENSIAPAGLPFAHYVNRATMRMVGGRIQGRAGQAATFGPSGERHGTVSDITFNTCALQYPPPFFPTTGHWKLAQYFEVNPANFTPAEWFSRP
jgi:hypothetical protein